MSIPDAGAASAVRAVITDFGGVLTSPLSDSFALFERRSGVGAAALGGAMAALAVRRGGNPIHELETGRLGEPEFLALLADELSSALGRTIDLDGFGEAFMDGLEPNVDFLAHLAELHGRGIRLAICTNNVREWSQRWRAKLPRSEIFDVVVDSSEIGVRKPDARIYETVLSGLGLDAAEAAFVDDLEVNCEAAARLGLRPVWFRDTAQAIADLDAVLAG